MSESLKPSNLEDGVNLLFAAGELSDCASWGIGFGSRLEAATKHQQIKGAVIYCGKKLVLRAEADARTAFGIEGSIPPEHYDPIDLMEVTYNINKSNWVEDRSKLDGILNDLRETFRGLNMLLSGHALTPPHKKAIVDYVEHLGESYYQTSVNYKQRAMQTM